MKNCVWKTILIQKIYYSSFVHFVPKSCLAVGDSRNTQWLPPDVLLRHTDELWYHDTDPVSQVTYIAYWGHMHLCLLFSIQPRKDRRLDCYNFFQRISIHCQYRQALVPENTKSTAQYFPKPLQTIHHIARLLLFMIFCDHYESQLGEWILWHFTFNYERMEWFRARSIYDLVRSWIKPNLTVFSFVEIWKLGFFEYRMIFQECKISQENSVQRYIKDSIRQNFQKRQFQ